MKNENRRQPGTGNGGGGMHILVTGGAGFIGSQIVAALADADHQVRVLDALIPGVHPPSARPEFPAGVEFIRADVRDESAVTSALRGIDLVCHQAAMVGRGKEILDAPNYVGCNDLGTAVLVAAMTRAGLGRLILGSSVVIYGDCRYGCPVHGPVRPPRRSEADLRSGRFEPRCPQCGADVVASAVTEDDPLDPPRNVYAVSKLAQEHIVGAWARETGASAVALRYHNVYGPGMPYDSPYSGVASAFRSWAARGEASRVFEDGGPLRDFVHVRDVAQANVAALDWARAGLRAFNVASGEPRSILQLAVALACACGAAEPRVTGEFRVGDVRHIFASPQRLITELGWRPGIDFETGVKDFATAPMRLLAPAATP
jgi:dTDP-L-rhamnose 4-epimerase